MCGTGGYGNGVKDVDNFDCFDFERTSNSITPKVPVDREHEKGERWASLYTRTRNEVKTCYECIDWNHEWMVLCSG